jgi:D-alanyl-D-alanine carboxypeptidase
MDNINKFKKPTNINLVFGFIITISIIIIVIIWYGLSNFKNTASEISNLSSKIIVLENKLASTTEDLNTNIQKSNATLSDTLKQNVGNIEQKLGAYSQEVGSYTDTVTTLQKLSKTDPQLLVKYSKVFFLNENYAPARLTEIPNEYKYSDSKVLKLNTQVWPYVKKMIDDAKKAGINIYAFSAYRSFNEQQALKGQYSVTYGAGSANSFSADQGYSEHQLGTTLDFMTQGLNGNLDGFENTKAYQWLSDNAFRYGFIMSYPKNNKFYVFEPWHWRFVGVELAIDLHNKKINFYDMDQRAIDEYLVSIFD